MPKIDQFWNKELEGYGGRGEEKLSAKHHSTYLTSPCLLPKILHHFSEISFSRSTKIIHLVTDSLQQKPKGCRSRFVHCFGVSQNKANSENSLWFLNTAYNRCVSMLFCSFNQSMCKIPYYLFLYAFKRLKRILCTCISLDTKVLQFITWTVSCQLLVYSKESVLLA